MNSVERQVLQCLRAIGGHCSSSRQLFAEIPCSGPEQMRVCRHLQQIGLIDYREDIIRFGLTVTGKTLLKLDTSVWPVTPDELLILRSCASSRIGPNQIHPRVPVNQRQILLDQLAQKQLIAVYQTDMVDLVLTPQGHGTEHSC